MYRKGDLIIYGNTGVCRVEDVGRLKNIRNVDRDKLYYTLAPLYSSGVIYVPADTAVFMRPVLSRPQAEALIEKLPSIREDEYHGRDQRLLTAHYRAFFDTHRCEDLAQLIKTVYTKNRHSLEYGRRPGQMEQRYMKRAEELLYGEFAVALGIPLDDVVPYIASRVESGGALSAAGAPA